LCPPRTARLPSRGSSARFSPPAFAGERFRIQDDDLHLGCYEIHGKQKTEQFTVGVENQFETDVFQTGPWEILCAPSEKTLPAP
jgi:hypothetical protein